LCRDAGFLFLGDRCSARRFQLPPSYITLILIEMKVTPIEPDFSVATIRLANEIHTQLVCASRRSRQRWSKTFAQFPDMIDLAQQRSRSGEHSVNMPVVSEFMVEWARNLNWKLRQECWDAIQVEVPENILSGLRKCGGVESFELLLGDTASFTSATLGSNNHNLAFGLILNCPGWITLASHNQYADSFERQLGMVIHHEMAHFRHQQSGSRAELHAHIRGLAWVLSSTELPGSKEAAVALLEQNHWDVWQNEEVQKLFVEGGESAWRLLRLWISLYKAHSDQA
jgi:hypothetical protein